MNQRPLQHSAILVALITCLWSISAISSSLGNDALQLKIAAHIANNGGSSENFGGFYTTRDGTVVILLKDFNFKDVATSTNAIQQAMQRRNVQKFDIRKADYGVETLWDYKNKATETLSLDGVHGLDIDEKNNRLAILLEDSDVRAKVESMLLGLGVDKNAVDFVYEPGFHTTATLRNMVRPLAGGLQITRGSAICTYGFSGEYGESKNSFPIFVTNAHCSAQRGVTEGTRFYQPSTFPTTNNIGYEIYDPEFFDRKADIQCPIGRQCQYADAILAYRENDVYLGGIYQAGWNELDITGEYKIADRHFATGGEEFIKVGRTTGQTVGELERTCVNVNVAGVAITMLCQDRARRYLGETRRIVDGGDSGSPVFVSVGNKNVALAGIVWGSSPSGDSYTFSPIWLVEAVLGPIKICHPDTPCDSDPF